MRNAKHSNLPSSLFSSQILLVCLFVVFFLVSWHTLSFLKPDYFNNTALFSKMKKMFTKEADFSLETKLGKKKLEMKKIEL